MAMRSQRVAAVLAGVLVLAATGWAGTVTGHVADYNAAEVKLSDGEVSVPAGLATYTATSTLAIGSTFTVTLPSGFVFFSFPSLSTSGTATLVLTAGGVGAQTATFTVATNTVASGQTITLAAFSVSGASALETVTPVANALPLTMQASPADSSPVAFKAFASDVGLQGQFVGAIQFIDIDPPSNGTEFLGSPDSLTAVISAIELEAQTVDAATSTVPILGSNGAPNTLLSTDTATVSILGNFVGIAKAFSSTTSDCLHPVSYGSVISGGTITIPNVPINTEVFFCVTGGGGYLQANPNGLSVVSVNPGTSTDFLANTNVLNEYPGMWCYTHHGAGFGGCVNWAPPAVATPAISDGALFCLAIALLVFGARRLKARLT